MSKIHRRPAAIEAMGARQPVTSDQVSPASSMLQQRRRSTTQLSFWIDRVMPQFADCLTEYQRRRELKTVGLRLCPGSSEVVGCEVEPQ